MIYNLNVIFSNNIMELDLKKEINLKNEQYNLAFNFFRLTFPSDINALSAYKPSHHTNINLTQT